MLDFADRILLLPVLASSLFPLHSAMRNLFPGHVCAVSSVPLMSFLDVARRPIEWNGMFMSTPAHRSFRESMKAVR